MIFIVGYSRSGTKMMNKILDKEGIANKVPEIHFFEQLYEFNSDKPQTISENELIEQLINTLERGGKKLENGIWLSDVKKTLEEFIRDRRDEDLNSIDIYRKLLVTINKNRPIDPTPRNAYYIKEISHIIPESKFIYMLRDPRDCILSQSKKWRNYYFNKGRPFEALRLKLNYNPSLMARFWKNSLQGLEKAKKRDICDRILILRYEDLTENPSKMVKKIRCFLNEDETLKSDLSFIRPGNTQKWKKEFSSSELYLIESVVQEKLKSLGYETSHFSFFEKIKGNLLGIAYWLKLPFSFLMNLSRIKNPWAIFKTRISNN